MQRASALRSHAVAAHRKEPAVSQHPTRLAHPARTAMLGIALAGLLPVACDRAPAPPPPPASAESVPAVPVAAASGAMAAAPAESGGNAQGAKPADSAGALQAALKPDMAYSDLRRIVTARGFVPVPDSKCVSQVAGDPTRTCAANPTSALCTACSEIPELSGYTGDGYATTRFRDARSGQRLEVISYGMIQDWNVADADSRLRVVKWSLDGR